MVHGVKIAVAAHGHVQGVGICARFPGDDAGGGNGAVQFRENGGDAVVFHFLDEFDELGGGSFAAGFLLHRPEDLQVILVSQVGKAVMEGDDLPAGQVGKLCLAVGVQSVQFVLKGGEIRCKGIGKLGNIGIFFFLFLLFLYFLRNKIGQLNLQLTDEQNFISYFLI